MSLQKVRDIVFIVCAIVFVIAYSISNLIPIFFSSWYFGQESFLQDTPPSIYADCQSSDNTNILTITISNYAGDDLENIKCNLVDKGGLISLEDSQIIPSLSSQSIDICGFNLEG